MDAASAAPPAAPPIKGDPADWPIEAKVGEPWIDKFGRLRQPAAMYVDDDDNVSFGKNALAALVKPVRWLRASTTGHAPREARNHRQRGSRRGQRGTSASSDDPGEPGEPPQGRTQRADQQPKAAAS